MNKPDVPWTAHWPEIVALGIAVLLPPLLLVFDLAERHPDLFQRAGLLTILVVAVVQFKQLFDFNRKHLLNASRAQGGDEVQAISQTHQNLGWVSLVVLIYGSVIATFGDKFEFAIIKLLWP